MGAEWGAGKPLFGRAQSAPDLASDPTFYLNTSTSWNPDPKNLEWGGVQNHGLHGAPFEVLCKLEFCTSSWSLGVITHLITQQPPQYWFDSFHRSLSYSRCSLPFTPTEVAPPILTISDEPFRARRLVAAFQRLPVAISGEPFRARRLAAAFQRPAAALQMAGGATTMHGWRSKGRDDPGRCDHPSQKRPPSMVRPPWPSLMHPLLRWRKMKGQGVSKTKGEK